MIKIYKIIKVLHKVDHILLFTISHYIVRHAQSGSIDDNFLTKMVEEPTTRGVLLDLVLTNEQGLAGDVEVGGSLGCSDHEKVELRNLCGGSRAISRITTLDFRRANFGLFKDLLRGIPWVRSLDSRGSKRAGHYLSVAFSVLRIGSSP